MYFKAFIKFREIFTQNLLYERYSNYLQNYLFGRTSILEGMILLFIAISLGVSRILNKNRHFFTALTRILMIIIM